MAAAVHDINLAAEFGDWVWLLNDGGLHASGRAEEVLTAQVLSKFTGSLSPRLLLQMEAGLWRAV